MKGNLWNYLKKGYLKSECKLVLARILMCIFVVFLLAVKMSQINSNCSQNDPIGIFGIGSRIFSVTFILFVIGYIPATVSFIKRTCWINLVWISFVPPILILVVTIAAYTQRWFRVYEVLTGCIPK